MCGNLYFDSIQSLYAILYLRELMSEKEKGIQKKFHSKSIIGGSLSINDLREMDYNNEELTPQQRLAILNYDRYRLVQLKKQTNDVNFNKTYLQLQVMANLHDYKEFLEEKYF